MTVDGDNVRMNKTGLENTQEPALSSNLKRKRENYNNPLDEYLQN